VSLHTSKRAGWHRFYGEKNITLGVDENGTGFAMGRHTAFGNGWTKDFGLTISTYLTANPEKILMDDRNREYASEIRE